MSNEQTTATIYTCSVCNKTAGVARDMFQVQPRNTPARHGDGRVTGIHCRACVRVAREYRDELGLQIYHLEDTIRFLARRDAENARREAERKAAAERQRQEANAFYQKLRVSSNGHVESTVPAVEDSQAESKARRAADREIREQKRAAGQAACERAAGQGYEVHVG